MDVLTNLNMNNNSIINIKLHSSSIDLPLFEGGIYYNTIDEILKFCNGKEWVPVNKKQDDEPEIPESRFEEMLK